MILRYLGSQSAWVCSVKRTRRIANFSTRKALKLIEEILKKLSLQDFLKGTGYGDKKFGDSQEFLPWKSRTLRKNLWVSRVFVIAECRMILSNENIQLDILIDLVNFLFLFLRKLENQITSTRRWITHSMRGVYQALV